MENMVSQVLPPLLNPRTTPPPPLFFFFFFFFLLLKKILVIENKYSVLDLPGNKFSGRAHDENK